jgi:protein-S-isoprenylcysteine O-methyltransferase Ste14
MAAGLHRVLHPIPSRATVTSVALLLAAFGVALYHADPEPYSLALGLPLMALGITIRLVTNSVLKKNQVICREGLYALCRHPMYVGSMTLACGIAVTLNHPLAAALLSVAVVIAFYRLRREEAYLLAKLPEYADYRRDVPAFPTPRSIMRAAGSGRLRQQLSLEQCFRNGEVFRLNLYLPLIVAAGVYFQRAGKLDLPHGVLLAAVAVLLAITAVSFALHPHTVKRRRRDYLLPLMLELGILAAVAIPGWK